MGLCLSVALWKEKLYADGGSGALPRGADEVAAGVKGGGRDNEILGGDVPKVVEEKAMVAAATGVKLGAEPAASAVSAPGGTPSRPIWQRKVLMGVRCRLPRFSGMILYDESGRPVCGGVRDRARDQEKHAAAVSVLQDML